MNRLLFHSKAFVRSAKKIVKRQPEIAAALQETLDLLAADAFDSRLRTHKLSGELQDSWACSAGYDLRILFSFVQHKQSEAILLESIGTHDEVY